VKEIAWIGPANIDKLDTDSSSESAVQLRLDGWTSHDI